MALYKIPFHKFDEVHANSIKSKPQSLRVAAVLQHNCPDSVCPRVVPCTLLLQVGYVSPLFYCLFSLFIFLCLLSSSFLTSNLPSKKFFLRFMLSRNDIYLRLLFMFQYFVGVLLTVISVFRYSHVYLDIPMYILIFPCKPNSSSLWFLIQWRNVQGE